MNSLLDKFSLCWLAAEGKPTENVENGMIGYEVDTQSWFVYYDGAWYDA